MYFLDITQSVFISSELSSFVSQPIWCITLVYAENVHQWKTLTVNSQSQSKAFIFTSTLE